MRHVIANVVLLLAGCAAPPVRLERDDVVGHYYMLEGPDIWDEIDLARDGRCTWTRCRAVGRLDRTASEGAWRLDGVRVWIDVDRSAWSGRQRRVELWPRRWRGHVYLVPFDHLGFFERCGPDDESCFCAAGAPLAEPPPISLPAATERSR